MMNYSYGWSFNLSVNPVHWLFIRIWIRNQNWTWELRHPLHVAQKVG